MFETSDHIVKLFCAPAGSVKLVENGKEIESPGIQLPSGVYEFIQGSYIFRGSICLYQDGSCYNLNSLPENFTIYGDLNLSGKNLTVLPNLSTTTVMGKFNCSNNLLKSLEGSPKYAKFYDCSQNWQLITLRGTPQKVEEFHCAICPRLLSLDYGPEYARIYNINSNPQLKNIQGLPNELDYLTFQDGPAHFNIKNKNIKIINISYCFRRTDLKDMPVTPEQIIHDKCANLSVEEIAKYKYRRTAYLAKKNQLEITW